VGRTPFGGGNDDQYFYFFLLKLWVTMSDRLSHERTS
jgi:hypothetical protein